MEVSDPKSTTISIPKRRARKVAREVPATEVSVRPTTDNDTGTHNATSTTQSPVAASPPELSALRKNETTPTPMEQTQLTQSDSIHPPLTEKIITAELITEPETSSSFPAPTVQSSTLNARPAHSSSTTRSVRKGIRIQARPTQELRWADSEWSQDRPRTAWRRVQKEELQQKVGTQKDSSHGDVQASPQSQGGQKWVVPSDEKPAKPAKREVKRYPFGPPHTEKQSTPYQTPKPTNLAALPAPEPQIYQYSKITPANPIISSNTDVVLQAFQELRGAITAEQENQKALLNKLSDNVTKLQQKPNRHVSWGEPLDADWEEDSDEGGWGAPPRRSKPAKSGWGQTSGWNGWGNPVPAKSAEGGWTPAGIQTPEWAPNPTGDDWGGWGAPKPKPVGGAWGTAPLDGDRKEDSDEGGWGAPPRRSKPAKSGWGQTSGWNGWGNPVPAKSAEGSWTPAGIPSEWVRNPTGDDWSARRAPEPKPVGGAWGTAPNAVNPVGDLVLNALHDLRNDFLEEKAYQRKLLNDLTEKRNTAEDSYANKTKPSDAARDEVLAALQDLRQDFLNEKMYQRRVLDDLQKSQATNRSSMRRSRSLDNIRRLQVEDVTHPDTTPQVLVEIQSAVQKLLDGRDTLVERIDTEHREHLTQLSESWRADGARQHEDAMNAIRATAQEQVPFNVQGYLDEFSRSLSTEVRMVIAEVSKLREERRSLQFELGTLLHFKSQYKLHKNSKPKPDIPSGAPSANRPTKSHPRDPSRDKVAKLYKKRAILERDIGNLLLIQSKYTAGGEFDPTWEPSEVPPPPPSPPPIPSDLPALEPPRRSSWRTIPKKMKNKSEPSPVGQPNRSWQTWVPNPNLVPTPPLPGLAPSLIVPNTLGLFGPRSPGPVPPNR